MSACTKITHTHAHMYEMYVVVCVLFQYISVPSNDVLRKCKYKYSKRMFLALILHGCETFLMLN